MDFQDIYIWIELSYFAILDYWNSNVLLCYKELSVEEIVTAVFIIVLLRNTYRV